VSGDSICIAIELAKTKINPYFTDVRLDSQCIIAGVQHKSQDLSEVLNISCTVHTDIHGKFEERI
jgi:hypothetical protein